jgi:hypothetical protein
MAMSPQLKHTFAVILVVTGQQQRVTIEWFEANYTVLLATLTFTHQICYFFWIRLLLSVLAI